jgi:hypothetical protein
MQQKPQKEPHMANKNTNPGGGKDDNEMRIQFGLILALCQNCAISHNPLFHAQNSNLFKGLSPMFPNRILTTTETCHICNPHPEFAFAAHSIIFSARSSVTDSGL